MNQPEEKERIGKKRQKYPEYFKNRAFRTVTFRKPEDEQVQKHAHYYGIKPTSFVRVATIAFMKGLKPLPRPVEREIEKLKSLWSNATNNLNQIAKRVNTLKKVTIFDLLQAKITMKKLINQLEISIKNVQNNDFQDPHPTDGQL